MHIALETERRWSIGATNHAASEVRTTQQRGEPGSPRSLVFSPSSVSPRVIDTRLADIWNDAQEAPADISADRAEKARGLRLQGSN
jgi:hypothetical protein